MNNNLEVGIYKYLDQRFAQERKKALKGFLENQSEGDLSFFGLDMYKKEKNNVDKILSCFYQSKYDPTITLTSSQIQVLNLLQHNNLLLSAPTSYGKTFVALEFIKRNEERLNNIVFIVPTLALMNELLKKIYTNFSKNFNICINSDQYHEGKNIFILVPERSNNDFIKLIHDNYSIDLLIIDEIYKLQKEKKKIDKDDRLILMNKTYRELIKVCKKILLLGPYIKDVSFNQSKLDIVKYYTNYSPVYNNVHEGLMKNWYDELDQKKSQLCFFSSPGMIYQNLQFVIAAVKPDNKYIEKYNKEIAYLKSIYHQNTIYAKLLERGVGIHHGSVPVFLRKFYEKEFREKNLPIVLCTNTLMEGINTPTNSLIIVNNPGDVFKLQNLIGRVGRLNPKNPTIGDVSIYDKKTLELMNEIDNWKTLEILSENNKAESNDELLYFGTQYDDKEKNEKFIKELQSLNDIYGITKEEIIRRNLKFNIVWKIANENYQDQIKYYDSIKKSTTNYDFVKIAFSLLAQGEWVNWKCSPDKKNKRFWIPSKDSCLTYKIYALNLLEGQSIKQIVKTFETKELGDIDNVECRTYNLDLLVDCLFNLEKVIRFKFSVLADYFALFKLDELKAVKDFVQLVAGYCGESILEKVLDDFGIEVKDRRILVDYLNNRIEKPSASNVLKFLLDHRAELIKLPLSPFSIRNIFDY